VKPGNEARGLSLGPPAVPKPRLHPGLGCAPLELHYDFAAATGALIMADGHCCNMEGCVELFTAIDARVGVIVTFSGLEKDTVYMRHGQGWQADTGRKR
jgi:hypothetical protein